MSNAHPPPARRVGVRWSEVRLLDFTRRMGRETTDLTRALPCRTPRAGFVQSEAVNVPRSRNVKLCMAFATKPLHVQRTRVVSVMSVELSSRKLLTTTLAMLGFDELS
jgi:hypothetical protein